MDALPIADGHVVYTQAFMRGLLPDPPLWIDEWSDAHMRIPPGGGAEVGPYKIARTPYAREPMQCLSPEHPSKRVVGMVASQLFKTQVGLNWMCGSIVGAPANILALMPSLNLAKRLSNRIGKTIDEVPECRKTVASPRSRDARNTIDTKEFRGGTLYITTAGSAANLAEIPARYIYGDEIDRWEQNVGGEGDPIDLAEARGSTFGRNAKFYYTSSPTLEGASRIADLFAQSDQRHYYVPCPHCGRMQILVWEQLDYDIETKRAQYRCINTDDCGALIDEAAKETMLANGEWRAHAKGDGETVGFTLSTLYSPPGWVTWFGLAAQYDKAKKALERGDQEPMQVFYNTRLARTWNSVQEMTKWEELKKRAEDYQLRTIPDGVLALTASVDVQGNRLELKIIGWGEGLERWVIDYQVIHGDPSLDATWAALDEILKTPIIHPCGYRMTIAAAGVDSGGHHTQEVYAFTRNRQHRHVLALKGATKPNRPVISGKPSKVDVTWNGQTEKHGAELWFVGTDTAKDWLYNRMKLPSGPGAIHFSKDLPDEFYQQLVAERRLTRYVKGFKRSEWVKAKADRNEALDLAVYNLAIAYYLNLHRYKEADWERLRMRINPPQRDIFESPAPEPEAPVEHEQQPASSGLFIGRKESTQTDGWVNTGDEPWL